VPRKRIALIGVDFGARELRAVEVSTDGRAVLRFAASPIAPIGVVSGLPTDADFIANSLRTLYKELSPATKATVLGLPAATITTRVLDIPQVPDAELRTILDGEVQHFGIVRGFGGMFDYYRLATGKEAAEPQALVMACEAVQLNAMRDGAERARVDRVAMEPSLLGLMRCAAIADDRSEPSMLVAMEGDIAEIAIIEDHRLRLYRRLELGIDQPDTSFLQGMGVEDVPNFVKPEGKSGLAAQLEIEVRRTLEYVKRISESATIQRVVLAISNPRETGLAESLAEGLGIRVDLAKAPLPGDDGIRFAAAYGLAVGSSFADLGVPLFDLSPFDPVAQAKEQQRRIVAAALSVSIAAVVASIAAAMYFGLKANSVEHDLGHVQEESNLIREVTLPQAMERQRRLEEFHSLSAMGVPVPKIVDSLTEALDANTGLNQIEINGSQMKLTGEAKDEASMIQTLDQLRGQPGFTNTYIESFDQDPGPGAKVVRFRLSTTLGAKSGGAM
jgi:Tfp pilus assembly PilM family ATPase